MSDAMCAVTIGNFDGVHVGHAALVRRARELAGPGGRVVAMSFDPHPISRLRPAETPARLTTFERRAELLLSAGADEVVKLEPTDDLLGLEPDAFIRGVVEKYSANWFVEGEDFHFGKRGRGTPRTLKVLGEAFGFGVEIVPAVEVELSDQLLARASSSLVRWLLKCGRVRDIARVLGRPYELSGIVHQGDQRGRTIGFPTANLVSGCMSPVDGVYSAVAVLPDGRELAAAVNVGSRPTFNGVDRRIEAHVIGEKLGLEYSWPLTLRFVGFVRDQLKFDGVARLVEQLGRDCVRAKDAVEENLVA